MRHRLPVFAIAACVATAPALAQPSPPASRIPTVTRLVKQFSELETALVAKAHAKDDDALDAMLDPAFEMRVGEAPGVPVPRHAWIRDARASPRESARIGQMAVHDLGNVAIVSFSEAVADASAAGRMHDRFVVDCWKRDGDSWKLAVRYASDAPAQRVKPPNAAATLDKRY